MLLEMKQIDELLETGETELNFSMEHFAIELDILQTLFNKTIATGASKSTMVVLEGISAESILERYPISSYTLIPSNTNYDIALEGILGGTFAVIGKVIEGVIIFVLKLVGNIIKFIAGLFGLTDNSVKSASKMMSLKEDNVKTLELLTNEVATSIESDDTLVDAKQTLNGVRNGVADLLILNKIPLIILPSMYSGLANTFNELTIIQLTLNKSFLLSNSLATIPEIKNATAILNEINTVLSFEYTDVLFEAVDQTPPKDRDITPTVFRKLKDLYKKLNKIKVSKNDVNDVTDTFISMALLSELPDKALQNNIDKYQDVLDEKSITKRSAINKNASSDDKNVIKRNAAIKEFAEISSTVLGDVKRIVGILNQVLLIISTVESNINRMVKAKGKYEQVLKKVITKHS